MSYQIMDEPVPGSWQHLVVNPMWPLFGIMFGGFWLALPWFVVNAYAMGSPTAKKTVVAALLGLAGVVLLVFGLLVLADRGDWNEFQVQYGLLVILGAKLGIAYYLTAIQSHSFDLYEYFGGLARNGIFVVIAGGLLRGRILNAFPSLVTLVMS